MWKIELNESRLSWMSLDWEYTEHISESRLCVEPGESNNEIKYSNRCDFLHVRVFKVVLYVCVLVSSVTTVLEGSMGIDGRSERRIASKGVWGGEGALAGSGLGDERDLKSGGGFKGADGRGT